MNLPGTQLPPALTVDEIRHRFAGHDRDIKSLADDHAALVVTVRELAAATGHEINLPPGIDVIDVMDRVGDDPEAVARG